MGSAEVVVEHVTAAASGTDGDLFARLRAIVGAMARDGQRGACIALLNERGELYIAAWDGELDESVKRLRLPVGRGMMGRVAAEGRPAVLADLDNPGAVAVANRSVGTNALTRSAIAVPIWYDGVVIGVLEMGGTRVGQFGADDVPLLEAIARTIADTVKRVEPDKFAAEVLRHRVHELAFLQQAAATLAASLDIADVAAAAVRCVHEGVGARGAALLRLRADGALVLAVEPGGGVGTTRFPVATTPFLARVATSREPVLAARAELRRLSTILPEADAVAGVRVTAGASCIAIILVAAPDERGLDPAQVALLAGIANLAGLALANAESFAHQQEAARRDPATGLINRSEFDRRLSEHLAPPYGVLAIDVDHLRVTNETVGHEAGDVTLHIVASTLESTLRETHIEGLTLARTGGDEFGVIIPGAGLDRTAQLAEQCRLGMYGVAVPHGIARVSIGCAATYEGGGEARQLWDVAVTALHRAKRWGRDRVEVSSATAPPDGAPRWDRVIGDLLSHGAIRAVYQPIVRLDDGAVAGCEALARPLDAAAMTDVAGLFTAAQSLGLSRDLDWLCRRAAAEGGATSDPGAPLFINIGVWTLLDPLHGVDQMLLLLRATARDPAGIVLEVTEREVVSDVPRLREVMDEYRRHGFRFAIDDVGEGHSTLEILAAGRPEFVKLARSVVATAGDAGSRAAIAAVLAFAEASGGEVIAEGIETADELERIRSFGIRLGQGFGLARPVDLPARSGSLGASA